MKTDLKKMLFISGEPGLLRYISQARNGIIAESLQSGKRSIYRDDSKVSALSDIFIYTSDAEVSLKDVFLKMKENLDGKNAPDPKSDTNVLEEFFSKVIPNYDKNRFYHSNMRKVSAWYNLLKEYASLDFEEEKEVEEAGGDSGIDKSEENAKTE